MVGATALTTGAGLLIVKVVASEVPPPGDGLTTVICAVPAADRSAAGIVTDNCVALTYVVGRELPFHCTAEDAMNPEPVSVTWTEVDPMTVDTGAIEAITAVGLLGV